VQALGKTPPSNKELGLQVKLTTAGF